MRYRDEKFYWTYQRGVGWPDDYIGPDSMTRWIIEKSQGFTDMGFYCLTKISIRAKRSISRVFSLFIFPSPFFVHCPYKGRINRAESVLTGLKPY